MFEELMGDASSVLRCFKLYQKATLEEAKKKRLEIFLGMAHLFEKKWNEKLAKNYKFSEWLRWIERKKQNEEIYKRTSR